MEDGGAAAAESHSRRRKRGKRKDRVTQSRGGSRESGALSSGWGRGGGSYSGSEFNSWSIGSYHRAMEKTKILWMKIQANPNSCEHLQSPRRLVCAVDFSESISVNAAL